jgi:outer membrane protein TolC
VELGKLENRLSSLRDLREPLAARFNAALNRDPDAGLPWPDTVLSEVAINEPRLFQQLANHPDLLALESTTKQWQKAMALAQKDKAPDVTLGVSYIDIGNAPFGASPPDDGRDAVTAVFSLNIPIQRKRISAKVKEARLQQWAAVREKKGQSNRLIAQLKSALFRLRDADRKIDLYRDTLIPKAEESLKVTEAAFRSSQGSFLDLIDAQRIYLEFQLAYERARADYGQSVARIEWLAGDMSH